MPSLKILVLLYCTGVVFTLRFHLERVRPKRDVFSCYKCDKFTDNPDQCTQIQECTQNDPQCSIRVKKTSGGKLIYNKACISEDYCTTTQLPNNVAACSTDLNQIVNGELCVFCTDGSLSNLENPTVAELAPFYCYKCDSFTQNPEECTGVEECSQSDPQCSIRVQKTSAGALLYSKSCTSKLYCATTDAPNNPAACSTDINNIVFGEACVFCSDGSLSNLENPVVAELAPFNCYKCNEYTSTPEECTKLEECTQTDPQCAIRAQKTSNGNLLYSKSCISKEYCTNVELPKNAAACNTDLNDIVHGDECTFCSDGTLSNLENPTVGELEAFNCYKCNEFTATPDECTDIEQCTQTDPQCAIRAQKISNGNLIFSKSCISKEHCTNVELPKNAEACSTDINNIVFGDVCIFCSDGTLSNLENPIVEAVDCYHCDWTTNPTVCSSTIVTCQEIGEVCSFKIKKLSNGAVQYYKGCHWNNYCQSLVANNPPGCDVNNYNNVEIAPLEMCTYCGEGSLANTQQWDPPTPVCRKKK